MRQDAPESVLAYVTLADVLVTVHTGAERGFRIVGVDQLHVFHPQDAVGVAEGFVESCLAPDVIAGREQMARVETESDGQVGEAGGHVANRAQFFEAGADVASTARGAFDEQREISQSETLRCFYQAMHEIDNSFLECL